MKKIKTNRNNFIIKIIISIVLLLVVLGSFCFGKFSFKRNLDLQKQSTQTIYNGKVVNQLNLDHDKNDSDKELLSVLTSPIGANRLIFSLNIPRTWRASLKDRGDLKQIYSAYNDNLAVFNFVSPYFPHLYDSGLKPKNQLGFYDVTKWIGQKTTDFFNTEQKPKEKRAYFNFLIRSRIEKTLDFSKCKSLSRDSICGGARSVYVQSSDGVFSGFVNIKTSVQAFQYDPTVYVHMAGNVDGKVVYIEGRFILYGEQNKQIEQLWVNTGKNKDQHDDLIKKALQQLHDDDFIPPDLELQYNEILMVLKSISVDLLPR